MSGNVANETKKELEEYIAAVLGDAKERNIEILEDEIKLIKSAFLAGVASTAERYAKLIYEVNLALHEVNRLSASIVPEVKEIFGGMR